MILSLGAAQKNTAVCDMLGHFKEIELLQAEACLGRRPRG